jgi:hypothetical protein
MKEFKDLEKKYFFNRKRDLINREGTESLIYLVEGFATKVRYEDTFIRTDRQYVSNTFFEYEVSKHFFDNGISVPKPHGVYLLTDENEDLWPAFMMEYLGDDYLTLDKLSGDVFFRARELFALELKKARSLLSYISYDSSRLKNSMYSAKKDDLKIFDFAKYSRCWPL